MQELLEEVISERQSSINVDFREALDFVKSAIEQDYLDKEKEQIINANRDGVDMVVDKKDFISGEQYYNETYNKQ